MGTIYIEADGVLMERANLDRPDELVQKGYYESLIPEWNMISALRSILKKNPDMKALVLCYIPESMEHVKAELSMWMSQYFRCACRLKHYPLDGYFGNYLVPHETDMLLSARPGNIALFAHRSRHAVAVDIKEQFLPGIPHISTEDAAERIEEVIRKAF